MHLTPDQLAQYDRDGFLVFPNLFSRQEIAVLRREVRPDWLVSRNTRPLPLEDDDGVLMAA